MNEKLNTYLKGFAMGTADAVPGVSGGTIALIVGIYERLIAAVTSLNHRNAYIMLESVFSADAAKLRETLQDMDVPFLTVLVAGILTAVITVLRLMHFLLQEFPVATFGFFFGLIAVSAVVLYRQTSMDGWRTWIAALAGFSTAFMVSGFASTSLGHGAPVIFVSGMVAVSAMVLPGISGSLMLVILGQYEYMSAAVSGFSDSVLAGMRSLEISRIVETSEPVVVFSAGALAGLLTVAHVVKYALEHHRKVTMAFLVSLVAGALRAPVIETERAMMESGMAWSAGIPIFLAAAFLGGILVYLLDVKTAAIKY